MQNIAKKVTEVLTEHELVQESPLRVKLENISELGYNIKVFAFIKTTQIAEFKQIANEINMEINRIVEESGAKFAKHMTLSPAV